ncbi:uncharacterized protein LOC118437507 [Folsomia candida]|uniref:uncharacterized protein LOC118437507 n=1 Tax=Folsomia candida TaxID=158441 RepID=UPI001604C4C3|nr:uncharacterized protein LOC118437507 [Folsomia candida]XP_035712444.1 uncharacterized protein LOC118437507 [Folsomia candida]
MANEASLSCKNGNDMNLPLTSSREERSSLNFDSKKVRFAPNKAMRNPLILDAVFTHLHLRDLKTSRLVCHDWNDVGVTLLGKRAYLHANKLFTLTATKLFGVHVTPVNSQLFRHLRISDNFNLSIWSNKMKTGIITQVLTEVPEVVQLTREIKFDVTHKEFVPPFLQGIRMLRSTKIRHVDISTHVQSFRDYIIPAETYQKLPPQPSLTSVKFKTLSDSQSGRKLEFQPLIKVWLDAAPNLTTLDIAASFYPNLEGCTNLKVLRFEFLDWADIKLDKVTKMLGQVKDSLMELKLSKRYSREQIQTVDEVPVMSQLTSLSIHSLHAYGILGFFDEDHFPKLKTLSLHHASGEGTLTSHLNLWRRHEGVQSLGLTVDFLSSKNGEEEDFGEEIVEMFPSVKELDLTMKHISLSFIPAINRIMESFKTWDLERVNVAVTLGRQISVLIEVLKTMSILQGVKSFQLLDITSSRVHFSPYIEDIILHSRGFKSFEISGYEPPEVVERMRSIFQASRAPVQFRVGRHT